MRREKVQAVAKQNSPIEFPTLIIPRAGDAKRDQKLALALKTAMPQILAYLPKALDAARRIDDLLGVANDDSEEYYLKLWSWAHRHLRLSYTDIVDKYDTRELAALIERAIDDGEPPIRATNDTARKQQSTGDPDRDLVIRVVTETGIEAFLTEHPGVKRTALMDYKAGRIKGRVGPDKCRAIISAAQHTAQTLGL